MAEHTLAILVKALGASAAAKEMKTLDSSIGGVSKAAAKGHAALSHFGGRLAGLTTAIGVAGLAGGALTLAGAMEEGVHKASDWGLAIEKLQGLTSNTAEQLSGLLGITEKFGISNERIAQIVGFTEKTLGKLSVAHGKAAKATKSHALQVLELRKAHLVANGESTKAIDKLIRERKAHDQLMASMKGTGAGITKLQELEKTYGVRLTDVKGKALDFQSVLLNVADAYAKATTAADKAKAAALSASVFGRGYADLLPILKLGRKGILDAEAAAAELGLTLSKTNVEDLAKFREASREAGDAVSGLELQLGLLVMPDITAGLKTFVGFMKTHRAEVQNFFRDGLHVAEGLASFVAGTLVPAAASVGSTFAAAWNMIPAPLRDIMVKGVIADRTIKFLFGFSPIHTVIDVGESALSKVLGGLIGKNIVQPVFVTNQIPTGGLPVVGGKGGGIGAGTILKVALVGIAAAAALELKNVLDQQSAANQAQSTALGQQSKDFGSNAVKSGDTGAIVHALQAVQSEIDSSGKTLSLHDQAIAFNIDGVRDRLNATKDQLNTDLQRITNAQIAGTTATDQVRDKVESNKIATITAGSRTAAAAQSIAATVQAAKAATVAAVNHAGLVARAGGQAAAAAIKDKDLSVTVPVRITVPLSVRTIVNGHTTLQAYQKTLSSPNAAHGA